MKNKTPVIFICGGTGTGKSKLAIDLANHYNAEIINSDAIQVYKGLDIATNKVTTEECQGIPHHLLGHIEPNVLDYCVHDFQKSALKIIDDLNEQNKVAIVVGGTNYYMESLLWHKLIPVHAYDQEVAEKRTEANHPMNDAFSMSNAELHAWLTELDPDSAFALHTNNRRKVWRALEIALHSGTTQYEHLTNTDSSKRRYQLTDAVVLWLYKDLEQLTPKLNKRVDEMIAGGLLDELHEIQRLFQQYRPNGKYTKGIFQAIGFKEFRDWLDLEDDADPAERNMVLMRCVAQLKAAHARYVKYQNRWVRRRLLRPDNDVSYPVFRLEAGSDSILAAALAAVSLTTAASPQLHYEDFVAELVRAEVRLRELEPSLPHVMPEPQIGGCELSSVCRRVCDQCGGRVFVTEEQWVAHIRGKPHHKAVAGHKRRLQQLEHNQQSIAVNSIKLLG